MITCLQEWHAHLNWHTLSSHLQLTTISSLSFLTGANGHILTAAASILLAHSGLEQRDVPSSNTSIYVNSGGVGMINTINRAELTGIAAALSSNCTDIATDSACSLSQIRKQLLYPEMQRKHTHSKFLERIASLIEKLETPIHFFKVKAHTGVIGNDCADAIAKHAALHNYGHDVTIPQPTSDGNPFSHMYWVSAEDAATTACPTTSTKLTLLQNLKDKLKQYMTTQHRLGDA